MSEERQVAYSYTTEQAIEDGVLIRPLDDKPALIITRSIHADCCEEADGRTYMEKLGPLLLDASLAVKEPIEKGSDDWPVVLEHTVAGTVWIMPNELGGITLLKPEDY